MHGSPDSAEVLRDGTEALGPRTAKTVGRGGEGGPGARKNRATSPSPSPSLLSGKTSGFSLPHLWRDDLVMFVRNTTDGIRRRNPTLWIPACSN